MKKLSIREVQLKAVEILVYIDKICRRENLRYSIFYGSLIGVERHEGFIPWDDDVDIVMPRPDYNRLMEILSRDKEYILMYSGNRSDYRYPFAKLVDSNTFIKSRQYFNGEEKDLGVFVDIFPLDGLPEADEDRVALWERAEQYRLNMMDTIDHCYARSFTLIKSLLKLLIRYPHHRKLLSEGDSSYWCDKYENTVKSVSFGDTTKCGFFDLANQDCGVFKVEWFDDFDEVDFEGYKLKAIKERADFLEIRYGDYMELPPENERVTHHPYTFFEK
ncbi:LicD family protein [Enterococcus asini]|uniref:LicD family protein n=1 Tax=Enterococcus asini TaxID=57732 RepID=UPI00288FF518|nr:LicD family protein [Enterococcus asini]MDT2743477.1 LicD family protein [Enterococcus asini]